MRHAARSACATRSEPTPIYVEIASDASVIVGGQQQSAAPGHARGDAGALRALRRAAHRPERLPRLPRDRRHGGTVGPSLDDLFQRRDVDWVRVQIGDPRAHNPNTVMPDFDFETEVDAIVEALRGEGSG